ncbi:hypothetical protein LTR62_006659 [Meristemomyces frigidus]|uniref:LIM zinc-binding domain-containing protein n=1 Tax=Meristemomyces frigidus TaxID=1508187 RepID=A0AAN7TVL7_9PEZI|nr:hypothetical protein LTR62_006659 [Meristemomyces frigidus]
MALAATLSSGGMRPASFLPAIKCSNCGDEIEIASMGEHVCTPESTQPTTQPSSTINPFTLRQMNAHAHMPHAPSPLQQQSQPPKATPLPQTRIRAPTVSSQYPPVPKLPRTAPPRINPDAANRPFLAPMQPGIDSPLSPAISVQSGSSNGSRQPPIRSATSPMPRSFDFRPPSPEMTGNLDCAFPPFPAPPPVGSESRPSSPHGRMTPSPVERAPSRTGSRQDSKVGPGIPWSAEPQSLVSDGVVGSGSAAKTGAINGGRRPSVSEKMARRRPSLSNILFGKKEPPMPTEPVPRPSTSHSMRSKPAKSPTIAVSSPVPVAPATRKIPPPRPERPEDVLMVPTYADDISDEPVMEMPSTFSPMEPPVPMRSAQRTRTFSGDSDIDGLLVPSQTLHRAPSAPQLHDKEQRPSLTASAVSDPSHTPQATARHRSQSRSEPRLDLRLHDAPPVPRPVQQHRTVRTHSPHSSGSSTASSAHSASSGGPSPVDSAASSIEAASPLKNSNERYGSEEDMRVSGLNLKLRQDPGMRAEQPAHRSPPRNFARPNAPRHVPAPIVSPILSKVDIMPMESPMDPALEQRKQGRNGFEPWEVPVVTQPSLAVPTGSATREGRQESLAAASASHAVPGNSSQDDYDPYRAPAPPPPSAQSTPDATSLQPSVLNAQRILPEQRHSPTQCNATPATTTIRPRSPQSTLTPPPPPIPSSTTTNRRPLLTRKSTATLRPTCRGCNLIIEGKSVKAADGRLTGRWHKSCFVCRSCEQPFLTADFYVIENQPYCEQHYHEKNGSLCHGCQRGIEGEYLETTTSNSSSAQSLAARAGVGKKASVDKKFHPRCFTCCDCRQVLSDDYFEISGRVFCERHALAAMRGQARMAGPMGSTAVGGVGGGLGGSKLNPQVVAERRTTRLMMM